MVSTVIVSAATVLDSLANVQRHVEGNLSGGVDHVVLILDDHLPEVEEWLATQPQVSYAVADEVWWRGVERPTGLNTRQVLNVNVVKALLTTVLDVEWLFHIDADEILRIDRAALAALPESRRTVSARVYESVHEPGLVGDPTLFKRPVTPAELVRLAEAGVIAEPSYEAYLRGHSVGKGGNRPSLDYSQWLHWAEHRDRPRVPVEELFYPDGLMLLHLESPTPEDFVRRWEAMAAAGDVSYLHPRRVVLMEEMRSMLAAGVPVVERRQRLLELSATMDDDIAGLRDLGFIVELDPRHGGQTPHPDSAELGEFLRAVFDVVTPVEKWLFDVHTPRELTARVITEVVTEAIG